jgi:hypothetical protein
VIGSVWWEAHVESRIRVLRDAALRTLIELGSASQGRLAPANALSRAELAAHFARNNPDASPREIAKAAGVHVKTYYKKSPGWSAVRKVHQDARAAAAADRLDRIPRGTKYDGSVESEGAPE